jgi:hypothetical protein
MLNPVQAGKRQVRRGGPPSVDLGDDVVDLGREVFYILGSPAVLAATPGAPPDQFFEHTVHRRSPVAPTGLEDEPRPDFQYR